MTSAIRVLKAQWHLVSATSCDFQIEGEGVECYFTESIDEPASAPNGNKATSVAVKTHTGEGRYSFQAVEGRRLWAYPKGNGAVVIVDKRDNRDVSTSIKYSHKTAFGETKVAEYDALAAWAFPYNISVLNYVTNEESSGTVTHSSPFAVLQTGTSADGAAGLSTRRAVRYQPGVGGLVRFTAIFTTGVSDSEQIIGYGDDTDGLFFGWVGAEFGVLRLSAGVEYFTPMSEWTDVGNVFADFDSTKLNVYQIQFQWLGGGEIRFYIENPEVGGFVIVHRIKYANSAAEVSIRNPSLPIHAHVVNSGNTTNLTLKTPSASAGLEGDRENRTLNALLSADNSLSISGTEIPIVSIRMPTTYEGLANRLSMRALWAILSTAGVGVAITTFRIYLNPTLTDPDWTQIVPGGAPAEADTAATAITGGLRVTAIPLPTQTVLELDVMALEASLVPGDILTIAAISTGNITGAASITFDSEI